jgi:hypothetical protein
MFHSLAGLFRRTLLPRKHIGCDPNRQDLHDLLRVTQMMENEHRITRWEYGERSKRRHGDPQPQRGSHSAKAIVGRLERLPRDRTNHFMNKGKL